jgi:hypothetical protein
MGERWAGEQDSGDVRRARKGSEDRKQDYEDEPGSAVWPGPAYPI